MPSQLIHIPSWPRWAALGLLFLSFITVTYERAKARNTSNALDQDLDLTLGLKIRHFEALSDGYHHPLLPALVVPFAEKDLRYFAKAKLLNVAIGALAFWVVAWVGLRVVGPTATFVALVAVCSGLSEKSADFTPEPLLLLLVTLTFYEMVQGFEQPWRWGIAGAFAGLAYLTKGSALLLPIAYAASVLRLAPKRVFTPGFWLFPAAFVGVASPLLLYNWHVYGWPLFNYNTAHVIWLDYAAEQAIMFDKGPPTMWSYLATHSLADILRRWLHGCIHVRGAEWVWPFLLIFLGLPKRWLAYFAAFPAKQIVITVATTLAVTWFVPFAWSAAVQWGLRYLLPIFPVIFLLLADVLVFYSQRLAQWRWSPHSRARLASVGRYGLVLALAGVWLSHLRLGQFPAPLAIDFPDHATAEVYHLLDTPAFDGTKVLFSSHELTGNWLFHYQVSFLFFPPNVDAAGFLPWLDRTGVEYILANKHLIQRWGAAFGSYLAYSKTEGVQVLRLAPGWEVIYEGPRPRKFVLIRVRKGGGRGQPAPGPS